MYKIRGGRPVAGAGGGACGGSTGAEQQHGVDMPLAGSSPAAHATGAGLQKERGGLTNAGALPA